MSQYGYPPQQPVPPQQKMSTGKKIALFGCLPITVLSILVVGGCTVVAGSVLNEVDKSVKADKAEDERAAREDVKIVQCRIVEEEFVGRQLKAQVEITNHGKKRADYVVEGAYTEGKSSIGELTATTSKLDPGESIKKDFGYLVSGEDLKGVTNGKCELRNVMRDEWSAGN